MLSTAQQQWLLQQSDFIARVAQQQPDCWACFTPSALLPAGQYLPHLQQQLQACHDDAQAQQCLRYWRQRWYAQLAALDMLGQLPLPSMLEHLTSTADAFILAARDWLMPRFCARYGTPRSSTGEAQSLQIIGMGKLGGGELNFSSDIDLIFYYDEAGETDQPRKPIENHVFFTRLAQALVALLDTVTVDGRVFRVDLRLRPFGQSGPLVASLAALEYYYQEQGRDWERYAMVKARLIGADDRQQQALHALLRPFVYRRYIDFSAIDALRTMKQLIQQEAQRLASQCNIKLGLGGIRELEFIAQSFQLIRGGQQRALQTVSLYQAYQAIAELQLLPQAVVQQLLQDYAWLRKLEHALQQRNDEQTQVLPSDPTAQQQIAAIMGADWADLQQQVSHTMQRVHQVFRSVIGDQDSDQVDDAVGPLALLWQDMIEPEQAISILQEQGLDAADSEQLWQQLHDFRQELRRRSGGPRGRKAMARLLPLLLQEILQQPQAVALGTRILLLLQRISNRTAYIELLLENQGARQQLLKLCAASQWLTQQLADYPLLLDELIMPQHLYQLPELTSYPQLLDEYLLRIPQQEQDLEAQVNALRQARQVLQLKVAAADISGALPLMKVSDHLSYLAEALIAQVVRLAWQQLVEKHGSPPGYDLDNTGIAVLGYGKLGGLELGYGSDLDLVFVCSADYRQQTTGARPLELQQFYVRLVQRILHLFTTRTLLGTLYEVDLRLRPDGQAGLLVTQLATLASYLRQDAWTWELQALVRARPVYGSATLQAQLVALREQILQLPREAQALQQQVAQMRSKMRSHLSHDQAHRFDLKQGLGGMADIEFITQYLVLRDSAQHPALTRYTDNIRILQQAAEVGVLRASEAAALIDAYLTYRGEAHRLALADLPALTDKDFSLQRLAVQKIWQQLLEPTA